ncbi:ABC transporter permease [Inquilinus limosus]|uniref:Osmoprotectant uptake system permease n=1 Tax=Inquilinus limosus TaxID=171674 RepID=A0A211YUA3_9PROT|nr:ABC transporter permease [Inquilinus limosus]OWJ56635.1 osmoprotectant uptake system permease [Inquilinus limosus]
MTVIRNRVLLVLGLVALAGVLALPVLTNAPNRLLSGRPIGALDLAAPWGPVAIAAAALLLAGAFVPSRRGTLVVQLLAGIGIAIGLVWLAGRQAELLAVGARPSARTSLGAGFWVLALAALLAAADAARRLRLGPLARLGTALLLAVPVAALIAGGAVDQLSLMKEYVQQHGVFAPQVLRHLLLVGLALVPTLLIGVPLGIAAHRSTAARGPIFSILGIIQTVPSIALFGLLIAPLSALSEALPWLGISGIGITPAVIALTLYSLLPIARNTAAGLDQVEAGVIDAARGIGMTRRQIFRKVEVPLALPVFLSGLRITLIQAIGLTAVAALIGAGGLGAVMFQGLFANALDLVLLGALPIILMAVAVDAVFRILVAALQAPSSARRAA